MKWKLAEAKQQLSRVVRLAQREPQIIQNRDEPVAAIVSTELLARLQELERADMGITLADAFARVREAAEQDDWELDLPRRVDRENAMFHVSERAHKGRARRR